MKTLFEKLKEETLRSIEEEALLYPSTMERLIETLKKLDYCGQLRINDAYRLLSLNKRYIKFNLEEVYNLFNEE
jgi:hypothetical protein